MFGPNNLTGFCHQGIVVVSGVINTPKGANARPREEARNGHQNFHPHPGGLRGVWSAPGPPPVGPRAGFDGRRRLRRLGAPHGGPRRPSRPEQWGPVLMAALIGDTGLAAIEMGNPYAARALAWEVGFTDARHGGPYMGHQRIDTATRRAYDEGWRDGEGDLVEVGPARLRQWREEVA